KNPKRTAEPQECQDNAQDQSLPRPESAGLLNDENGRVAHHEKPQILFVADQIKIERKTHRMAIGQIKTGRDVKDDGDRDGADLSGFEKRRIEDQIKNIELCN